jgi:hypothetical protein
LPKEEEPYAVSKITPNFKELLSSLSSYKCHEFKAPVEKDPGVIEVVASVISSTFSAVSPPVSKSSKSILFKSKVPAVTV